MFRSFEFINGIHEYSGTNFTPGTGPFTTPSSAVELRLIVSADTRRQSNCRLLPLSHLSFSAADYPFLPKKAAEREFFVMGTALQKKATAVSGSP